MRIVWRQRTVRLLEWLNVDIGEAVFAQRGFQIHLRQRLHEGFVVAACVAVVDEPGKRVATRLHLRQKVKFTRESRP